MTIKAHGLGWCPSLHFGGMLPFAQVCNSSTDFLPHLSCLNFPTPSYLATYVTTSFLSRSRFPLLRPFNKHKLQFRYQEYVFLGYSTSHKEYRCLAPHGRVYISKGIIFNEQQLPYPNLFKTSPLSCNQYQQSP